VLSGEMSDVHGEGTQIALVAFKLIEEDGVGHAEVQNCSD
jgi:hypothetical protein